MEIMHAFEAAVWSALALAVVAPTAAWLWGILNECAMSEVCKVFVVVAAGVATTIAVGLTALFGIMALGVLCLGIEIITTSVS